MKSNIERDFLTKLEGLKSYEVSVPIFRKKFRHRLHPAPSKIIVGSYDEIHIMYRYPFSDVISVTYEKVCTRDLTLLDFFKCITGTYEELYTKPETYKIWGHDISDLLLTGIEEVKSGVFELGVNS